MSKQKILPLTKQKRKTIIKPSKDVKRGLYTEIKTHKELDKFLNAL